MTFNSTATPKIYWIDSRPICLLSSPKYSNFVQNEIGEKFSFNPTNFPYLCCVDCLAFWSKTILCIAKALSNAFGFTEHIITNSFFCHILIVFKRAVVYLSTVMLNRFSAYCHFLSPQNRSDSARADQIGKYLSSDLSCCFQLVPGYKNVVLAMRFLVRLFFQWSLHSFKISSMVGIALHKSSFLPFVTSISQKCVWTKLLWQHVGPLKKWFDSSFEPYEFLLPVLILILEVV